MLCSAKKVGEAWGLGRSLGNKASCAQGYGKLERKAHHHRGTGLTETVSARWARMFLQTAAFFFPFFKARCFSLPYHKHFK